MKISQLVSFVTIFTLISAPIAAASASSKPPPQTLGEAVAAVEKKRLGLRKRVGELGVQIIDRDVDAKVAPHDMEMEPQTKSESLGEVVTASENKQLDLGKKRAGELSIQIVDRKEHSRIHEESTKSLLGHDQHHYEHSLKWSEVSSSGREIHIHPEFDRRADEMMAQPSAGSGMVGGGAGSLAAIGVSIALVIGQFW